MSIYYNNKAKKHKKLKSTALQFEAAIDGKVRDLLLKEFFDKVCKMFYQMRANVFVQARKALKLKMSSAVI